MTAASLPIHNLDDLRRYVHHTICEHNELEVNVFEITEKILLRGGKPCGVYFCLHGPRSVKLTAIWETESNTILFYGSTGQRMHRTHLVAAPELQAKAA